MSNNQYQTQQQKPQQQNVSQEEFLEQIAKMPKEDRDKLIRRANSITRSEKIEEKQKGLKTIQIEDFYNPRVKPFASNQNTMYEKRVHTMQDGMSIYSVFAENNGLAVEQHGGNIFHYFGTDKRKKIKFMDKELGDEILLPYGDNQFTCKFLRCEMAVSDKMVDVIAKELGKTREEILV